MKSYEIKQIDIGGDLLEHFWPDDEECFYVFLTIGIGVKGEEGADNYDIMVCTPSWLNNQLYEGHAKWGRHKLIMKKFDPDLIRKEVNKKILEISERFDCDDGVTFSEKMSRYAHWEFEDYVPYSEK